MEDGEGNWLETITKDGLPRMIAGPAGAAVSRLIGSAVEIPVAWLDGFSQSLKDRTDAKSKVSKAIAERTEQMVVEEPEIMERAMNSMLAKEYRRQANKEAVAVHAVDALRQVDEGDSPGEPSEVFMSKFERYAEDASADDIRLLFGRLLAGEIKNPGAVSVSTLHFASMLDQETAESIMRVLPYCDEHQGCCYIDAMPEAMRELDRVRLEQAGFWTTNRSIRTKVSEEAGGSVQLFPRKNEIGMVYAADGDFVVADAPILTKPGLALLSITDTAFDWDAVAGKFIESGAELVEYFRIQPDKGIYPIPDKIYEMRGGAVYAGPSEKYARNPIVRGTPSL